MKHSFVFSLLFLFFVCDCLGQEIPLSTDIEQNEMQGTEVPNASCKEYLDNDYFAFEDDNELFEINGQKFYGKFEKQFDDCGNFSAGKFSIGFEFEF